jgi:hypothetical protein
MISWCIEGPLEWRFRKYVARWERFHRGSSQIRAEWHGLARKTAEAISTMLRVLVIGVEGSTARIRRPLLVGTATHP